MMSRPEVSTLHPHETRIYGDRLRSARLLRRMLAKDLAEQAGISSVRLTRLQQADESPIEQDDLVRLAMALSVPAGWLTSPPRTFLPEAGAHFRANSRMTKTSEQTVSTWQSLLGDLIATLARRVNLLNTTVPTFSAPEKDPGEAARAFRRELGLSDAEPIRHVIRAAETLGIFVGTCDFQEDLHLRNHDASSVWIPLDTDRTVPVILCRTHAAWERIRFSVAHEIGHIVMHKRGAGPDKEQEATDFAAQLLLPATSLRREWPEVVTVSSLYPLKQKWGLSIAALIMHGHRHGLISDSRKASMFKQLSNRRDPRTNESWRKREPGADDRPVERPLLIANAIEVAYGVPPALERLFADLPPTRHSEWYREFLYNFSCGWSRDLDAERHQGPVNPDVPVDFVCQDVEVDNVIFAPFGRELADTSVGR